MCGFIELILNYDQVLHGVDLIEGLPLVWCELVLVLDPLLFIGVPLTHVVPQAVATLLKQGDCVSHSLVELLLPLLVLLHTLTVPVDLSYGSPLCSASTGGSSLLELHLHLPCREY